MSHEVTKKFPLTFKPNRALIFSDKLIFPGSFIIDEKISTRKPPFSFSRHNRQICVLFVWISIFKWFESIAFRFVLVFNVIDRTRTDWQWRWLIKWCQIYTNSEAISGENVETFNSEEELTISGRKWKGKWLKTGRELCRLGAFYEQGNRTKNCR